MDDDANSNTHSNTDSRLPRRTFLALTATAAVGLTQHSLSAQDSTETQTPPITGEANADLAPLDELMTSFIKEHDAPGASLAVSRQGKLVYARGFGYADVEKQQPVQPTSLFRIASVSKPITAVAVMRLVQQGKLGLDDKVLDHLSLEPHLEEGKQIDPRWQKVTVRHCLQHTGGWDRDASYDAAFIPWKIAESLGVESPVTPDHIVRYMLGQPLDFDPGTRYAYSNLGYLVLGRILESVAGEKYEPYMKQKLLAPLGIKHMQLGRALIENRVEGEVRYYARQEKTGPSLYPPRLREDVPTQYGAQNLEGFEAHGGWIASPLELVRFASAVDGSFGKPLLNRKTRRQMWSPPPGEVGHEVDGKPKETYYACGWSVRNVRGGRGQNTWHTGLIDGTEALLVRRWDGLNWAVLFNIRQNPAGDRLSRAIDPLVHQAVDKVTHWPTNDQFDKYLT